MHARRQAFDDSRRRSRGERGRGLLPAIPTLRVAPGSTELAAQPRFLLRKRREVARPGPCAVFNLESAIETGAIGLLMPEAHLRPTAHPVRRRLARARRWAAGPIAGSRFFKAAVSRNGADPPPIHPGQHGRGTGLGEETAAGAMPPSGHGSELRGPGQRPAKGMARVPLSRDGSDLPGGLRVVRAGRRRSGATTVPDRAVRGGRPVGGGVSPRGRAGRALQRPIGAPPPGKRPCRRLST